MKQALFIAAGIFTLLVNANAQNVFNPASVKSGEPLYVKYIETQGDYLIFTVEINAAISNKSTFKIDDAVEGELYSNTVNTSSKVQTMKIEKRENQVLDFKLVSGSTVYIKTFTTYAGVIEQSYAIEKGIAGL